MAMTIITVNGPLRKASRLSEDASDRGHTIRLFASLVDSLTDLDRYYNELAKEDEKSLRRRVISFVGLLCT